MNRNKLYFIVITLISIFLFTTAAICNQCEIPFKIKTEKTTEEAVEEAGKDRIINILEWYQKGNTKPITSFEPKKAHQLEDNYMEGMWRLDVRNEEALNHWLSNLDNFGLKRARLTKDFYDWVEIEETGEYSTFNVTPYQDRAITELNNFGIKVRYCLVYWDNTIQTEEGYSRFKKEEEIKNYLDYVEFIVSHFKGRIDYYEILNESNLGAGTQQYVKDPDYTKVAKEVISIINQIDSSAKVVVGAVSGFFEQPGARDYLFYILQDIIMPSAGGISFHSNAGFSPECHPDYYQNYTSMLKEIKDVASYSGFDGEYIADELQWRTPENPHPTQPVNYSEIVASKYYIRGVTITRAMDFVAGLCDIQFEPNFGLKEKVVKNLSTVMSGAKPLKLDIEIQSEEPNILYYSFSLPDGDKLIAIWNDIAATEEDSTAKVTLNIRNLVSENVRVIDVLRKCQQDLEMIEENENLVINNFIVRDYPLTLYIE